MRLIVLLTVMLLITLAGCSTTKYVCKDGSEVSAPTLCPEEADTLVPEAPAETVTKPPIEPAGTVATDRPETGKEETVPDEEPAVPVMKDIDPDIQELLGEAYKVKSYSYEFYGPKPYDEIVKIYVKGDLLKLVYRIPIKYNGLEFDTVYLDKTEENGVAYCEDIERGPCVNPNFKFSASYADFQHKLPIDWVDEIVKATEVSSEYIGNRNVLKLEVTTTLGDGLMWIDDYYGMPVLIQIDGTQWEYRDIVYNSVADDELVHQELTPRPIEESE